MKPAEYAIGTPARRSARSQRALEVAVAGEAQPAALGVAQPQPLHAGGGGGPRAGGPALLLGRRSRSWREPAWPVRAPPLLRPRRARAPAARRRRSAAAATPGGPDLDVGAHLRADAAVEARGPAAVLDLAPPASASCQSSQSQSLSRPESRWSQGSTSSCSRSRVVYQATSTPLGRQRRRRRRPSTGRRRSARSSRRTARRQRHTCSMTAADAAVAAGEQSFDDAGLAVVVAEADGLAVLAVGRGSPRAASPAGRRSSRVELGGPLERGVRLGHEPADATRCSGCPVAPGGLPAGRMTCLASSAICSTSSSVSVGSPHMK